MRQFVCDVCGTKQRDKSASGWFTLSVEYGGRGIRVFRWPTGRDLREAHDSLHHLCGQTCLRSQVDFWAKPATTEKGEEDL
jgi:hypothetical protein